MVLTCLVCTYARVLQHAFVRPNQLRHLAHPLQRSVSDAHDVSSTRAFHSITQRRIDQVQCISITTDECRPSFRGKTSSTTEQQLVDESALLKWSFLPRERDDTNSNGNHIIQNILVCGDGDLSFSADIASQLESLNIRLFASVLEDEATHNKGKHC